MSKEKIIEMCSKEIVCLSDADREECQKHPACRNCPYSNTDDEKLEMYKAVIKLLEGGMNET